MKAPFLLYLVAALAPTVLHAFQLAPSCMYDYMCSTDVPPELGFGGNEDACQAACSSSGPCQFWVYTKFHDQPQCYLLEHCDAHNQMCKVPNPDADIICASGPKDCPTETFCAQLPYPASPTADTKLWKCWDQPAPYSDKIPSGTTCTISCPSWKDGDNGEPYPDLIQAVCSDTDTWDVDHNVLDAEGNTISPDTAPAPDCGCSDIVIPPDVLEAGDNGGGAELYVNNVKQDPTSEITITGGDHAVLLCDRYPILDFSCLAGTWTDAVVDCTDIYCYERPTEEKCGMEPTTPAAATPVPINRRNNNKFN